MAKVAVEIDPAQIETAISQLNEREKWKIANNIISEQFGSVINKFRKTIKRKNLTYSKIDNVVEKARMEFHEKKRS